MGNNVGCLYQIRFQNVKSYLGITNKSSGQRLRVHIRNSRRTKQINCALHNALRKHPKHYTLKELAWSDNWDVLCRIEQQAIKMFNTKVPNGYNGTNGGEGQVGNYCSEETRQKIRISSIGRHPYSYPEEKKKKMRDNMSVSVATWWAERQKRPFSYITTGV